jgi:hypothetical protein
MPTNLKITRTKNTKRARIGISFEFNADDPQAERIYRGVGLCLREALTTEEALDFQKRLEVERLRLGPKSA